MKSSSCRWGGRCPSAISLRLCYLLAATLSKLESAFFNGLLGAQWRRLTPIVAQETASESMKSPSPDLRPPCLVRRERARVKVHPLAQGLMQGLGVREEGGNGGSGPRLGSVSWSSRVDGSGEMSQRRGVKTVRPAGPEGPPLGTVQSVSSLSTAPSPSRSSTASGMPSPSVSEAWPAALPAG